MARFPSRTPRTLLHSGRRRGRRGLLLGRLIAPPWGSRRFRRGSLVRFRHNGGTADSPVQVVLLWDDPVNIPRRLREAAKIGSQSSLLGAWHHSRGALTVSDPCRSSKFRPQLLGYSRREHNNVAGNNRVDSMTAFAQPIIAGGARILSLGERQTRQ